MVRTGAVLGGKLPVTRASAARVAVGGLFLTLLLATILVPRARTSFCSARLTAEGSSEPVAVVVWQA